MTKKMFKGGFPGLVTPFTSANQIDEAVSRRLINFLLTARISGILVNGLTGEIHALSREERKRMLEIAVDEVRGRTLIMAGVHADSTMLAVEMAQDAKEAGADCILLLPPWVVGPFSPEAICEFHKAVDTVNIPIVLFPFGVHYPVETIGRLAELKNVVSIKQGATNFEYEECVDLVGNKISILAANDPETYSQYLRGADGWLLATGMLTPHWLMDFDELIKEKKLLEARELWVRRLLPVNKCLFGGAIGGADFRVRLKEAMVMLGLLDQAIVRSPGFPARDDEKAEIRKMLETTGLSSYLRGFIT
ncbi:dihydrodipicolinate synthase family protein [Chloroflexota bacterium]